MCLEGATETWGKGVLADHNEDQRKNTVLFTERRQGLSMTKEGRRGRNRKCAAETNHCCFSCVPSPTTLKQSGRIMTMSLAYFSFFWNIKWHTPAVENEKYILYIFLLWACSGLFSSPVPHTSPYWRDNDNNYKPKNVKERKPQVQATRTRGSVWHLFLREESRDAADSFTPDSSGPLWQQHLSNEGAQRSRSQA